MDILTGSLTLSAAVVAYWISRNIWITLLVTIAAVMILRSLKPALQATWERQHPSKKLRVLWEEGTEENLSLGVRILLLTQGINLNWNDPEQRKILEKLLEKGLQQLKQEKPVFRYRYDLVKAQGYPLQICYGSCGKRDTSIRMRYYEWMKFSGLSRFRDGIENRDVFTLDMVLDTGTLTSHNVLFQAVFDRRLPVPQ
jgi:hypothetical protein